MNGKKETYLTDSLIGVLKGDHDLNEARDEALSRKYHTTLNAETKAAPVSDVFYSEQNLTYVQESLQQLRAGKGIAHELIESND